MALDDILYASGDRQMFVLEIPIDLLNDPDDILFTNSRRDFVFERPSGTLNAPLDWMTGEDNANGVMVYNLTLSASGGASYFAF